MNPEVNSAPIDCFTRFMILPNPIHLDNKGASSRRSIFSSNYAEDLKRGQREVSRMLEEVQLLASLNSLIAQFCK
ncbi:hypothetical protein M407DRAFT_34953 [Tulasnella calospora MUT 4182]|uniref:Uncharacterized protein n=1 Tax=Tulasnella calospora MUT 4182 TaxID=1051891 RepID=A0A0C3K221_9AGAM|nr:hypothetical protein M407DRAFT_34953 [Tulasnella calospora MUT 4182]